MEIFQPQEILLLKTIIVINAVGDARTLTLNNSLTVADGNDGTIKFNAASKTLTVEDNSIINQDLTTDATVTFGGLTVDGEVNMKQFEFKNSCRIATTSNLSVSYSNESNGQLH